MKKRGNKKSRGEGGWEKNEKGVASYIGKPS